MQAGAATPAEAGRATKGGRVREEDAEAEAEAEAERSVRRGRHHML